MPPERGGEREIEATRREEPRWSENADIGLLGAGTGLQ